MVTDYDCWHPEHDAVTVEMVVKLLMANAEKARALIKTWCRSSPVTRGRAARAASARSTTPHHRARAARSRHAGQARRVAGRVLK